MSLTKYFYHQQFSPKSHRLPLPGWDVDQWHSDTQTGQDYYNGGHKLNSSFFLPPTSIHQQSLGSCQHFLQFRVIFYTDMCLPVWSEKYGKNITKINIIHINCVVVFAVVRLVTLQKHSHFRFSTKYNLFAWGP